MGNPTERVEGYEPLGATVVLRRDERPGATEGGLKIPETAMRDPRRGVVIKSGPGRYTRSGSFVANQVKDGDVVLTTKHHTRDIIHEGTPMDVVQEEQCLCVIEGKVLRPIGPRVVVRRLDRGEVSDGGIVIPDEAQENRRLALVIAVGPGRVTDFGELVPPRVAVGDTVLTVKYRGVDIDFGGAPLQILDESDCMIRVE